MTDAPDAPRDEPGEPGDVAATRGSALRQAASVAIATGSYGVSFGALATASGLSVAQACVLSLVMFTGGSQFAFAGVVGSGGGAVTAVSTAGLLGLRNAFYGLQMAPLLRTTGWRRLAAAQITIDESTAVAMGQLATSNDERTARMRRSWLWRCSASRSSSPR